MFDNAKIYDISPLIHGGTAVFPGDTPFKRKVVLDFNTGDKNLLLSALEMSAHLGSHVDAPNHYDSSGVGIDERELNYYLGSAQVIELRLPRHTEIKVCDIEGIEIKARRVLFKTKSYPNPDYWNSDFNSLSAEVVNYLAEQNVILVGIDTPSIDLEEAKILNSHQAVFKNNMAILEGIVLDKVREGIYTLIALPLKIAGGDASPVRAVLIDGVVHD